MHNPHDESLMFCIDNPHLFSRFYIHNQHLNTSTRSGSCYMMQLNLLRNVSAHHCKSGTIVASSISMAEQAPATEVGFGQCPSRSEARCLVSYDRTAENERQISPPSSVFANESCLSLVGAPLLFGQVQLCRCGVFAVEWFRVILLWIDLGYCS